MLFYSHRFARDFNLDMENSDMSSHRQRRHIWMMQEGYGSLIVWLEKLRELGAKFLVISSLDKFEASEVFYKYVNRHYPMVSESSDNFYIFNTKIVKGE